MMNPPHPAPELAAHPAPADLPPGSVIAGRFTLEALAGRGGMGSVYRARDSRSGQPVALKLLHTAASPHSLQRFQREAQLLAELHHPGIVSHVAHGATEDGLLYLAMEWLEGEDLARRLVRQPLTLSETLGLIRCAAQALDAVHQRGILHRDIKPSNLFLRSCNPEQVVLVDFGLARHAAPSLSMTASGMVVGTPGYMSPEQAASEEQLTPAADLFSLGCVLYQCLTGKAPFEGTHFAAVMAKILFAQPEPLRKLRPDLPESFQSLVDQLLAKDVLQRVPQAQVLLARLLELESTASAGALPANSQPSPSLASAEQQLVSVLLASSPTARPQEPSQELTARNGLRDALRTTLALQGTQVVVLADGSLVVMLLLERGSATDQAAVAARCALLVRESWPEARVVLTTGRSMLDKLLPVGEAMDRAGQLLRQLEQLPASASAPIALDEVTAALLGSGFALSRPAAGLFLLQGEHLSADESRPLLGKPTPCVGREQELTHLDLFLTTCVEESAAQAVLITSPAGMGKSRLRHEFLRRLEQRGESVLVLMGRGDPVSAGSAYGVLGQALRRVCGVADGESLEARQQKLRQRLSRHLPGDKASECIEFLGELCSIAFADEHSPRLRAARGDPRLMSEQVERALVAFLQAECTHSPVLLVLEDLHWGDALTIKAVEEALRRLGTQPFLVLALARPEVHQLFPGLWSRRMQEIVLRGLPRKAGARLARQVLGTAVPDSAVDRLLDQCGGNALYLEELIRLTAEGRSEAPPETVLAMLQSRLSRLEPRARQVMRAASVLGSTFWAGGLQALLGPELSAEGLDKQLRQLEALELIEKQRESRFPGETEYRFRHALVREAAYGLVPDSLKPGAHRLAGQWLEQVGETDPQVLAEHYQLGGQLEQAVHFHALAAEQLFERHDMQGTLRQVQAAQRCGASGAVQLRLKTLQALAAFWLQDFATLYDIGTTVLSELTAGSKAWCLLLGYFLSGAAYSGRKDEISRFTLLLLSTQPEPEATTVYVEALTMRTATGLHSAQEAATFLHRLAEVEAAGMARDPLTQGWLGLARGNLGYCYQARPWQAFQWTERGTGSFLEVGAERNSLLTHIMGGGCLLALGDVEGSVERFRECLTRARHTDQALLIDLSQVFLALSLVSVPEWVAWEQEARALVLEVLGFGRNVLYVGVAHEVLAGLAARHGAWAEAEAQARKAHETLASYGPYRLLAGQTLCSALLAQGLLAEARAVAALGVQELESMRSRGVGAVGTYLALAEASLALGDASAGEAALRQALQCLRERAGDIPSPAHRERFLSRVPENARTLELARKRWGENEARLLLSSQG